MSVAFPEASLTFLDDLAENNDKAWFHANKSRYERELKEPSRAVAAAVNEALQTFSPAHALEVSHKALSRINRDIRFSKDKTPYNTRVWAGFHNQTVRKGSGAGYYFGIDAESCGVGAGAWMPPSENLAKLRSHIAEHHADLEAAVAALPSGFGPIAGEKLKRVPKPFAADHPAAELLKHKGMHIRIELPRSAATADGFVDVVVQHMRALKPFVDFLDAGLA